MSICWIIGHKTTLADNGLEMLSQPFIVFDEEAEADAACDMVERVSGERPMKAEGSRYQVRSK